MGNLFSHKTLDKCLTEIPKRFLFSLSRCLYDDDDDEEEVIERLDGVLPADLMREILVKLPSKSLMRFLSVSKAWRSEILSPTFIHKYKIYHQHKYVSFIHCLKNVEKGACLISKKKNIDDPHAIETYTELLLPIVDYSYPMELCIPAQYWRTVSVGSSNGLVCMRLYKNISPFHKKHFLLWNPAKRQLKSLSSPSEMYYEAPHGYEFTNSVEGFSYVPSTGDYKLVSLVLFKNRQRDKPNLCCALVLNMAKSNNWRKLKKQELPFTYIEKKAVVADGCLNLLVSQFPMFNEPSLLSFDLDEEIIRYTSLPYFCDLSVYKENPARIVSPNFREDDKHNGEEDERIGQLF